MRRLFWATILSLAVCMPAKAADRMFDLIGVSGGSVLFMDMNSKTTNGSIVTYWSLFVNPPLGGYNGKFDIHYIFSKVSLDCEKKTTMLDESVAYDRSDVVRISNAVYSPPNPIKEGTLGVIEYQNVCLGHRVNEAFKMLSHVKDAVAYGDSIGRPVHDAPSPND